MTATVKLWGKVIGAVQWDVDREIGVFEYDQQFTHSGIEICPITMPLRQGLYQFPQLRGSFSNLPGLVADSLPDKFGNRLIDAWLASQGRQSNSMNPVERLCYIGRRAMGALEFEPTTGPEAEQDVTLDVAALTNLANKVLSERESLVGLLNQGPQDAAALQHILRVGTSAGGARAKALLLWNRDTGEFRSGQLSAAEGFEYWLLKFDGVSNNRDRELADPLGYGRLEFAYYLMARDAGIEMTQCRLHEEGGRAHFMTRRFDRTEEGRKIHMLSLAALCHYDYNDPSSYSYEQAMQAIRQICTHPVKDAEQQLLRTAFNVVARNQDDHVKNIAFLMDPQGHWRLSPAFDISYAWNPDGSYTSRHQMSVNGKRDDFSRDDLMELARTGAIRPARARKLVNDVVSSVSRWMDFAKMANVDQDKAESVRFAHRLSI
ncbi:MAG: type II toxin-antitoxin system HipA family toxin [Gammaproteobacteria bacterium]|nr:type II toxin-antitoxin system HipA family toxin [Gammaproteobacteria bacterium]MDP2347576.1 type II toxin-antitoxin system HipA family toxin [Gammaproteobacteria bacterium]